MPFVFFQSKNTLVHISLAIGRKNCSAGKIPQLERIISPFYHFNKLCTVTVKRFQFTEVCNNHNGKTDFEMISFEDLRDI